MDAIGDSSGRQLFFAWNPYLAMAGPHGQDDSLGLILPVLSLQAEEVSQVHDLLHLLRLVLRSEPLGLGQYPLRELNAINALWKTGIVLIEAAHSGLRAVNAPQNQRLLPSSGAVHGSGQPCRACSYYDHIIQANSP